MTTAEVKAAKSYDDAETYMTAALLHDCLLEDVFTLSRFNHLVNFLFRGLLASYSVYSPLHSFPASHIRVGVTDTYLALRSGNMSFQTFT